MPELLVPALEQLEQAFRDALLDPAFTGELDSLLRSYAGRPTPLYRCRNLVDAREGEIYLKREDLVHGGAHKTNQVLGQALLARRMGKGRLIAETGAGQHGVATAMVGALLSFRVRIYMGAKDMERQHLNVLRMRLMGAEVVPVRYGDATLKEAVGEALRDWSDSYPDTHYLLGTAAGPHPFPTIVRRFQEVIGAEARSQYLELTGQLPEAVVACVGGGSNAIGIFSAFIDDPEVQLVGVEPYGRGSDLGSHAASLARGRPGILHGTSTLVLQDDEGQIGSTHSVAAGLDYPAVGPEHVHLQASRRARYIGARDEQAIEAFTKLAAKEGIIPALESAHALAGALQLMQEEGIKRVLVNLSGRGDKDLGQFEEFHQQRAKDKTRCSS